MKGTVLFHSKRPFDRSAISTRRGCFGVLLLDMPLDVVVPTGLPTNMALDELLADFGIIKDIGVGKSAVVPLYVSC